MTLGFWTGYWWWWLLSVFVSWAAMEGASLVAAHMQGTTHIQDWTLSDTIRRWSVVHRWLAPIAVGITAMLVWHFFGQSNPA